MKTCSSAGDGTLAFAIFAFLFCFFLAPLFITRIAGLNFPTVRDVQQSLQYEMIVFGIVSFCFFVDVCTWGVCFTAARDVNGGSVTGKAFGLMLSCFLFQLFTVPIYWLIKSHPDDWMIGIGATRSGARSNNDGMLYGESVSDSSVYGDESNGVFSNSGHDRDSGSTTELVDTTFSYKANKAETHSNGGQQTYALDEDASLDAA